MASTDDGVRRGVEGMGTRDGVKKGKQRKLNDERAGAEEQVGRLPPHDSRPHPRLLECHAST